MKRILTILLIVMMVFSITGCDPEGRAKLAGYMGKMGENVMGADMSAANESKEAANVTKEDLKAPEGGKVTIGGVTVEADKPVLPEYTEEQQKKVIKGFQGNDKAKAEVVASMKEKITEPAVIEAAKSSAKVMDAVLKDINKNITEEQKKDNPVLAKVAGSLDTLQTSLKEISAGTVDVTQGDVTTIQLVQTFVKTVSENQAELEKGNVPDKVLQDASDLYTVSATLSEASNIKLSDLMSMVPLPKGGSMEIPAGTLPLGDLEVKSDVQGYIAAAYQVVNKIIGTKDFVVLKSGFGFHKVGYENYANMLSARYGVDIEIKGDKSVTSIAKRDEFFDTKHTDANLANYLSIDSLMQYVIAETFSEGDDFYTGYIAYMENGIPESDKQILVDTYIKLFGGENPDEAMKAEAEKAVTDFIAAASEAVKTLPDHINGLIQELGNANEWAKDPSKIKENTKVPLFIPEKYKQVAELEPKVLGAVASAFGTGKVGGHQYFLSALNTLNNMLVIGDTGELLEQEALKDADLNYGITKLINEFYK